MVPGVAKIDTIFSRPGSGGSHRRKQQARLSVAVSVADVTGRKILCQSLGEHKMLC